MESKNWRNHLGGQRMVWGYSTQSTALGGGTWGHSTQSAVLATGDKATRKVLMQSCLRILDVLTRAPGNKTVF